MHFTIAGKTKKGAKRHLSLRALILEKLICYRNNVYSASDEVLTLSSLRFSALVFVIAT